MKNGGLLPLILRILDEPGFIEFHGALYRGRNHHLRRLEILFRLIAEIRPQSIIEVGCSDGLLSRVILETESWGLERYLLLDANPAMVSAARSNLRDQARAEIRRFDVTRDVPEENPPDLLICSEVLEHLPDPVSALERLFAARPVSILLSVPDESGMVGIVKGLARRILRGERRSLGYLADTLLHRDISRHRAGARAAYFTHYGFYREGFERTLKELAGRENYAITAFPVRRFGLALGFVYLLK